MSAFPPARRVQWMRDCWPAPIPMREPWNAYATLFDCVYFSERVATIRSVTADAGSCVPMLYSASRRRGDGTNLLVFCSNVLEQLSVDLGVVPLLPEMNSVNLLRLNFRWVVRRIDLIVLISQITASDPRIADLEYAIFATLFLR